MVSTDLTNLDTLLKKYYAEVEKHREDWKRWGWTDAIIYVPNEKTPPEAPKEEVNEWGVVSP